MWDDWQRRLPNCEPIAYQLRAAFPDRWVRFHSLPESKRYPESESEVATVLERFNRVLGELVPYGELVAVLTTSYSDTPTPPDSAETGSNSHEQAVHWRTVAMHQHDETFADPCYWHIAVQITRWQANQFDPVVRLVADDSISNVMIAATDCRWVLHPYDGGMDVILESTDERNRLKAQFADWLSRHPAGL